MSFGLNNYGETYQRIMNKIFEEEICKILEIYLDDMIVKFNKEEKHDGNMTIVFQQVQQFNIRLNRRLALSESGLKNYWDST